MGFDLSWRAFLEISLISVVFYYAFLFVRGTRAYQVLKGMALLLIIFVIAKQMEFVTITYILGQLFGVAILAMVVLFQPEIRRAFAALGRTHFETQVMNHEKIPEILINTALVLSEKRVGALFVISRENTLTPYSDTGVLLNSEVNQELLVTIFMPRTPLHDGAVILDGNRIVAAACLLPLSQKPEIARSYGTRHRAAIGLTDETDALVIVVSEETGSISIASAGKINTDIDTPTLKRVLDNIYLAEKPQAQGIFKRFIQKVFAPENRI
jgi:diadenylate cyclase